MKTKQYLKLGELIEALEPLCKEETLIEFDTGDIPMGLCSYRGYYKDLSITYDKNVGYMFAEKFLNMLKNAVGKIFVGWKGGEFMMSATSEVWVSNEGECKNTKICGISLSENKVILYTVENVDAVPVQSIDSHAIYYSNRELRDGELVKYVMGWCDLCNSSFGGSMTERPAKYLNGKFYHPTCFPEAVDIFLADKRLEELNK